MVFKLERGSAGEERGRINVTIDRNNQGMVLRDFLRKELHVSHRMLSAIKYKGGHLRVDGTDRTVRHVLQEGEVLSVVFPPETPSGFLRGEPMPLDIVYEDDFFLVINKPAGMPSIPSSRYPSGTLANGVLAYFESKHLASTVHIVNRLDRNTSGLLLVAKNRFSHERFFKMQKRRELQRRYLAVVGGRLDDREGVIDAPIGRRAGSIIERCVDWQTGKRALTSYRVLDHFADATLIVIRLQTGRTHQIRVHFASIGHPLLGDELYGGSTARIGRQALHSFELNFIHPFTDAPMRLHACCPDDFASLLRRKPILDAI
ncbi:MAG: RluA family pseudouridine synthase [Sporolactobacillus sp.]|jgi:23S rRNA pseudouridine1911/1915/1917 synthase|nr:RluA family pseudouridine synthase [Sporolactobacillus sp.]